MTDFHRSLDRALEHDPHNDWGFGVREMMAAELGIVSAARDAQWAINSTTAYDPPPVDRSFVDAFEPLTFDIGPDLISTQGVISRMMAATNVEMKRAQAIAAGFMRPLATQEIPTEGQE